MDYNKIRFFCTTRGISIPQLAEKIGYSKGLYASIKNESLSISALEKIAEVLEVPVSSFFEDGESTARIHVESLVTIINSSRISANLIRIEGKEFSDLQNKILKAKIAFGEMSISISKKSIPLYNELLKDKKHGELIKYIDQANEIVEKINNLQERLQTIANELQEQASAIYSVIPRPIILELLD